MKRAPDQAEKPSVFLTSQATPINPRTAWVGFGPVLSIASLITIILASLGYGVSLSVESEFGLPHASVFTSAFDLIDLSSVAIMTLLNAAMTDLWSIAGLLHIASRFGMVALILCFVWIVLFLLIRVRKWPSQKFAMPRREKTWFRTPTRDDSHLQLLQSLVWPAIAALSGFASTWIACVVLLAIPVALAILPSIGHELGRAHFKKWVIGAQICTPLRTRDTRQRSKQKTQEPLRAVDCVALSKDGKTLGNV
ncbi:hypothetical protein VLK31_24760 [Variovorax sp. H27-G14]|uniref:hypothetical protein n=1 Tax=Variovorax sp. H27-G14 TaxID=3111914 RepID=UPI0038FC4C1D